MNKLVLNDKEWFAQKCVDADNIDENKQIIDNINHILDTHSTGAGLAANQLGYNKRIAVIIRDNGERLVLVNPIVLDKSKETVKCIEGCLSFPGSTVATKRHKSITVQCTSKSEPELFTGFEANVIQHEIDHLNGTVMFDREYKVGGRFTPKKKKRKKKRR